MLLNQIYLQKLVNKIYIYLYLNQDVTNKFLRNW